MNYILYKSLLFPILSKMFLEMVFCYQNLRKNCSSDQEKLLKFETEGQEFAKFKLEKKILGIEKNFINSRLKAKNLQNF